MFRYSVIPVWRPYRIWKLSIHWNLTFSHKLLWITSFVHRLIFFYFWDKVYRDKKFRLRSTRHPKMRAIQKWGRSSIEFRSQSGKTIKQSSFPIELRRKLDPKLQPDDSVSWECLVKVLDVYALVYPSPLGEKVELNMLVQLSENYENVSRGNWLFLWNN